MRKAQGSEPLAEAAVRAALGAILWIACPILFVVGALAARVDHPGAAGVSVSILAAAFALTGLAAWWWRRPPQRAHLAAGLTIAILQLCLVGQILAAREPALSTLQVILALGTAIFLIDPRWVIGLQLFGLGSWLAATRFADPTPQWQLARFVVVTGFLVAGAFYFGRRRSFDSLRRLTDEGRRQRATGRQSAEALRESEERLREAQRIAHVGSYLWDIPSDRLIWSDEHYRIFGWQPGEPVDNRRFIQAVHPDDRAPLVEAVARSLREGDDVELEYRILRADGQERFVYARSETTRGADGEPLRHVGVAQDLTERHRAAEEIQASKARLHALLTGMDAARAVVVSRDGTVSSMLGGPERSGAYGIPAESVPGMKVHDFVPGDAGDEVMRAVSRVYETGERAEVDAVVSLPKGEFYFDVSLRALRSSSGAIESVLALVRDMTAHRAEARARRHAQKLESLGVLAGGIAHDFNNLLVGILSNAETALMALGPASKARGQLEDIFQASLRAAELTQELVTYAGDGGLAVEPLDLHSLAEETARLVGPNLTDAVRVEVTKPAEPVWVEGDAAQIRQVVMNFITNAAEAMAKGGGTVEVRVGTVDVDRSYLDGCYLRKGVAPGRHSCVEVVDRGVGMDRATRERVFEPFFTTKFQGRGLGLASTVGIVRSHGGTLRVESELDQGSTFAMLLPSVEPAPRASATSDPAPPLAEAARVLVVDDEELVRTATARVIASGGNDVVEVSSGEAAVEAFESAERPFDLALVDLTMPGMDGEETFDALRARAPTLPVLFMSGHSPEELARRVSGRELTRYIRKPFRRAALHEAISSLLGERD